MKKKEYMKPQVEVIDLNAVHLLFATSATSVDTPDLEAPSDILQMTDDPLGIYNNAW